MRQTNHIILDFENSKNIKNSNNWISTFLQVNETQPLFMRNIKLSETIQNNKTYLGRKQTVNINSRLIINKWNQPHVKTKHLSTVLNLININFLRKEKLYTKLKYSRSPAYDIVSGGAAALFAGFLGFLVSEKFGFELVDSGDFYFLTMYIVFLCFSVRPLLLISDLNKSIWDMFSFYSILNFYSNVTLLWMRFFKK